MELLAVGLVGVAAAAVASQIPVVKKSPLLVGAGLYTLGYVVSQSKPAGGWPMLPGPA
jgi:hypothetical protein